MEARRIIDEILALFSIGMDHDHVLKNLLYPSDEASAR